MWRSVTVAGSEQTLINLANVCYIARTGSQTEIRFTDREVALFVEEDPTAILAQQEI